MSGTCGHESGTTRWPLGTRSRCGPDCAPAALVGAAALMVLPRSWPPMIRASATWDLGGATCLLRIPPCSDVRRQPIKARAARRDDRRLVILTLILLAITASFAAIAGLIVEAKLPTTQPPEKLFLAGLAIVTLMISWTVTQVAFALHYAHDYYSPDPGSDAGSGLVFPGCEEPDYWDFLYFSTSIGATSQTSDTSIKSRALQGLVTLHATVAFFFNTAVLATDREHRSKRWRGSEVSGAAWRLWRRIRRALRDPCSCRCDRPSPAAAAPGEHGRGRHCWRRHRCRRSQNWPRQPRHSLRRGCRLIEIKQDIRRS